MIFGLVLTGCRPVPVQFGGILDCHRWDVTGLAGDGSQYAH